MSSIVIRAVKVALAVTVAVGIAAYVSTGLRSLFVDIYLVAIGGVLLLALVRTTRVKAPPPAQSSFERALTAMRLGPADTGELTLVRELDLSVLSAFHLHVRLRPVLREIAAQRLRVRYGVDLDREPGRAQELIGAEAWEVVRPQRPPPADRLARGPTVASLDLVVTELEEI